MHFPTRWFFKLKYFFWNISENVKSVPGSEFLTFDSMESPRSLRMLLLCCFLLVLRMSTILEPAVSLACRSCSLALLCSSATLVLKTVPGSGLRGLGSSSPSRTELRGTMIWETRLEMFDLTISSLARAGNSALSSAASSSLANSLTKQIWRKSRNDFVMRHSETLWCSLFLPEGHSRPSSLCPPPVQASSWYSPEHSLELCCSPGQSDRGRLWWTSPQYHWRLHGLPSRECPFCSLSCWRPHGGRKECHKTWQSSCLNTAGRLSSVSETSLCLLSTWL